MKYLVNIFKSLQCIGFFVIVVREEEKIQETTITRQTNAYLQITAAADTQISVVGRTEQNRKGGGKTKTFVGHQNFFYSSDHHHH